MNNVQVPIVVGVLRRAANLIDDRGWVRGTGVNKQGCMCALGAMDSALREADARRLSTEIYDAVYAELATMGQPLSISYYNDHVAKDKRYVTRLLRRTARKLEASS